ncbi:2,3-diaminopropionate biosynthesis protein SbnA [Amycolatopsis sp. WAC 04169]|uniref:2,3-diaminopropionate biosynthesis protein SbnA n=1 Tax=Amycolatopsis sp. WAC 04169 TaxID=2203197 RepID=UPI000F7A9995|nr:2,3-diaminopropionate biosynthesis protein SbnA [Amycolatopsis sp. WAC 04169]RSN29241.1 2,3-diaminopropionate biosynthesis protein SbnA [Amycolatopsis sp. WAC 04169]
MPVIGSPEQYTENDLYVTLENIYDRRLYLKCEGFNFAGSIKLKAAAEMVDTAERKGLIGPDSILVESSSGNLGVALAMLATGRGYAFLCVTDTRCTPANRRLIEAFGGVVHVVTEPDPDSGYLGARIAHVRRLCSGSSRYVWLDQYSNPGNWIAHYRHTAPGIADRFPDLDVLFVGAGTTGTLMGCARFFRRNRPRTQVVAVDAVGSVTFSGAKPGPRMIPGIGTTVRPALLDEAWLDDVVHVAEPDAIEACRRMAAHGFLFGGSTGAVVSGALRWLTEHEARPETSAVAIAPDLGERYLGTVYRPDWVRETYENGKTDLSNASFG